MSFIIEDKELFSQLIESLVKEAQSAINPIGVAKKLVDKLHDQYAGVAEKANIVSSGPTEIEARHLKNLGTLFKYMDNTKLTVDGARVVINKNDYPQLSKDEQDKLSPVSVKVGRISNPGGPDDRHFIEIDYHVNLSLLYKYIAHLQQRAKEMGPVNGKVLEVYVGKLIDQVNDLPGDSGLSRKPKSEPGQPQEIPDGIILDSFGTKIFDALDPYKDSGGGAPLDSKDIRTKEALNSWLQQGPAAQISTYDAKKQQQLKLYTDPTANKCVVLSVLYKRAVNLHSLAKNIEDGKKYSYYIKKIQEIAPSFVGPDGKACSVSNATEVTMTSPNAEVDSTSGTGTGLGGLKPVSSQVLEQIVQAMPLDVQDIDFDRINSFLRLYQQMLQTTESPQKTRLDTALTVIQPAMNACKKLTNQSMSNYPLYGGSDVVVKWLKPPVGQNYMRFLENLETVIESTAQMIQMFYNSYVRKRSNNDRVIFDESQKAEVEAQIQGYSIFKQNWNKLKGYESDRDRVVSFK